MAKAERLRAALLDCPATFKFADFVKVMRSYGFELDTKGATSGSRVRFYRESDGRMLIMHSPHPGSELSSGAIRNAVRFLSSLDRG